MREKETLKKIGKAIAESEVFIYESLNEALPPIGTKDRDIKLWYQNSEPDENFEEPHNLSNLLHDSSMEERGKMTAMVHSCLSLTKREMKELLDILLDNLV